MTEPILSEALHRLGKENSNAFVIQIGANDGISFDDTRGFLDMYLWPALLVEPIPEIYNQLKSNFSDRINYFFEQSAITTIDGPIEMLNVPENVIKDNDLHPGYKGMSALYPLKNGFGTDYERDIYVKNNLAHNIEVNGITFQSLLAKHNISTFDVFICDAEGHDWEIFKQLDLSSYRPKVIRLEYMNLTKDEQSQVVAKLESNNYLYEISGQDIDAVDSIWWNASNEITAATEPQSTIEDLPESNPLQFQGDNLNNIIQKYGSDKFKSGYSYLYQEVLKPYRNKKIKHLEIGLGTLDPSIPSSFCGIYSHYEYYKPSAILRAWREYFTDAEIYGIDVAPDCMIQEEGIRTFLGSSTDSVFTEKYFNNSLFDTIIDDGLHTADAQYETFKNFFNKVKDGGLYIVEDIGGGGDGECFYSKYQNEIAPLISKHEFFFGGNILIVRKNNSALGLMDWGTFINPKLTIQDSESELDINTGLKTTVEDSTFSSNNLTIVSGLWDMDRVGREWSRYEEHFDKFLKIPCNMYLWIPKSLEDFVWSRRSRDNTVVKIYELEDIKTQMFAPFWDPWQNIRSNPLWQNQAGWLPHSPQCKNEYYNPVVMSKMFFLHDSKVHDPFGTDYFIWLDAGISQTVYENYFYEPKTFESLTEYLDPFLFLSYPYEADTEIHGFTFSAINKYANDQVDYVCRGGLFGGHKDFIGEANADYYALLNNTLSAGYAGTEESIFSIMSKISPEKYRRYALDGNGLIVKFIEALQNNSVQLEEIPNFAKCKPKFEAIVNDISGVNTSLYFLTFNYPEQLLYTIESLKKHDNFLTHPSQKILIDNSTNESARQGNAEIARTYGFEHLIQNKNTGICGGRQFAAEHFDSLDSDFYLFFEDDMTISDPDEGICRNGFQKYVPDLYRKLHQIMLKDKFDFLKLSYTEVYMDNNIQVSWYNVPQHIREEIWPNYSQLPVTGLDPNAPRTQFQHIELMHDTSYISGNIYYANWPHITSREGNKKMFINTKWAHPYEQTWMSHIFQESLSGNIRSAVLLASPVTHERFKHYQAHERIES